MKSQETKDNDLVFKLSIKEVYHKLGSRPEGLTVQEIAERQQLYGENKIAEPKGQPLWKTFMHNFTSMMALLLWAGGAVALFFTDTPELGVAIWFVNIINGLFSFFQEFRANKATEALKQMLPSYVRVVRDSKEEQILAENLVPGDIMLIEEGDRISADGRLLDTTDLQVNQSALTGESNPIRKHHGAMDEEQRRLDFANVVFAGTTVTSGSGRVIITDIGMTTEFGKIANLTQSMEQEKSPLQEDLDHLTKQISVIATSIGACFLIAAVFFVGEPLAKAFVFALGMVVAFIPEGLLPSVTLSLAMAVQRMAKEHALVKKLSSVETLGATSVICSDKTGTLTQNEMTVNHVWVRSSEYEVTGIGYAPEGKILKAGQAIQVEQETDLSLVIKAAALVNNARILPPNEEENARYTVLGDPTEACLNVVVEKAALSLESIQAQAPRLRELPFDSRRKRMTTIHEMQTPLFGSNRVTFTKGAPKETVEASTMIHDQGELRAITAEDVEAIMAANDAYAMQGLRVLAVTMRLLDRVEDLPKGMTAYTPELLEQEMIFLGLMVMADPPREEVAEAVRICHEASIRIIMITGDYGLTAVSIAKRIGIVQGDNPRVVTGIELQDMTDSQLKEILQDEVVFARVAPEQKYRVVSCLQELGNVVAVTGDGVNDAPALKKADIGVAMGITGTDVAKESADMILTDDNFASIVKAVEEGRTVYSNIQKFLMYIFSSNMAEAVPSSAFLFSKGRIPLPLTVMQILTIDIGTDLVPALGLGIEEAEEGVMQRPPRRKGEPLLNKRLLIKAFFWYGALEALLAMAAFFFSYWLNAGFEGGLAASGTIYREATTMTLGAIIFAQIGSALNARTVTTSVFKIGLFSNKMINLGILIEIIIFAALAYLPVFHSLFNTAPIGLIEWLFLLVCPIPMVLLDELRKKYVRQRQRSVSI